MKGIKTIPVEKKAIQELTGEQLELMRKFEKSKEFEILKKLAELEKYNRYKSDFLTARNIEDVNFIRGINIGIDFIMDSVERAKEELNNRGDIDNDEDNK